MDSGSHVRKRASSWKMGNHRQLGTISKTSGRDNDIAVCLIMHLPVHFYETKTSVDLECFKNLDITDGAILWYL